MLRLSRSFARLPAAVVRLALAHFVVDGYTNIYPPLLPLLVPRLGLSLAAAGALTMVFQLAASVSQLGFGRLADRWRPRLLLSAGPVVAVVALSATGLAGSAQQLALVLVAGGLGCAAFHPPAAVATHRLGGARPGFAMSVYVTGGMMGFSLGPLLFAPWAARFGLAWTMLLAVPGLFALVPFLRRIPPVEVDPDPHASGLAKLRPYARPLTLLYVMVVLRTLTALCLTTYVPLMLTRRGLSVAEAGSALALYLVASGVGGFFGGPAADRWGPRRVMIVTLAASAPFLAAAPAVSGIGFVLLLSIGGFLLLSTQPVSVTFGQTIAPVSAGTVASLMMGVAWGTGGLAVPLVGLLADRVGVELALGSLAVAPVAAALCAWPLPSSQYPPMDVVR